MSAATTVIGTRNVAGVRDATQYRPISRIKLKTVTDLLNALEGDKQLPMLRTTAGHVADCLEISADEVTIASLAGLAPRFTTYLEGRRHKKNAVRSYRNYLGILVRKAKELGWTPQNPEIPQAWEPIVAAIKGLKGGRGIVNFAINLGKTPSTLTDDDMNSWGQMMLVQKRDYQYVRRLQYDFRRFLSQAGLTQRLPGIFNDWKSAKPYFVPLSEFPLHYGRKCLPCLTGSKHRTYGPADLVRDFVLSAHETCRVPLLVYTGSW